MRPVLRAIVAVPPQGKYDEARFLYNRAIQTWEETGDSKLVDAVTSMADMYMKQVRAFEQGSRDAGATVEG